MWRLSAVAMLGAVWLAGPTGTPAGGPVLRAALGKHRRTDFAPLVTVLLDWPTPPGRALWKYSDSPFFQALDALVRRQGLFSGDYIEGNTGRAQILGVQGEELVLAVMGQIPLGCPGTTLRRFILLKKSGTILDTVQCLGNSRYGVYTDDVTETPAADGARIIVRFPGGWHNYHRITYAGKTYRFREDERKQDPEWDRNGLCRIGVEDKRLRVLFPRLWPKPEGVGLSIHLVKHWPGSSRGSICEGAEKYVQLFSERGPDHTRAWMPSELRWVELACPQPPEAVTAEHGGREYLLVTNVPWYTMKPHSSGPEGKAWGLERVRVTRDDRGRPAVGFRFDADGTRLFREFREGCGNGEAAFVVDDKGRTIACLGDLSPERLRIEGLSTDKEATELAEALRRGMVE